MVKLFVADDEEIIREGIRNCIDKEQESYVFCGEAPDGEMALPLIQEMKPDVLITDVRMPFMDGLELAAIVKKTMPWVHIVILSGHDEFEYAQKAVSLGVDAYILKPVNSEKLLSTLQDVSERIEKEKQAYLDVERHQKRDEMEKNILREHFLSRLVTGAVSLSEALELARKQNLNLIAKKYVVCQSELDGLSSDVLARIRLIGDQLFREREDIIWFLKGADRLVFIIKGDNEEGVQETAYETAQMLRHELDRYLEMDISIGIGSIVDRIGEFAQSYTDAKTAISNFFGLRGNKIIGFADIKNERISPKFDLSANVPLYEKLRHANEDDVGKIVDAHFEAANRDGMQSVLYRYYLLMDLVVTAVRIIGDAGNTAQDIFSEADNPQELLSFAGSQEDTLKFAEKTLKRMIKQRDRSETVRYAQEIRRAKEYINDNFADASISLHTVAEEVGFSPNHFSTIFSQETGETFVEYLTKRRIEAAKKLLRESDRKLSDIAFDIGYSEPHYFSYIFKKHTGVSPREYRSGSGT